MKKQFVLAPIFRDNMVFQANKPIRIFGTCKKGIELNICFLGQETTFRTKSKEFLVEFRSVGIQEKGFSFEVYTKKQMETVYNCLVGEVFLIAGGKNVRMPLKDSYQADDMANFSVRFLNLNEGLNEQLKFEHEISWNICGKSNLANTSALSYLISKHLSQKMDVPMGIIIAAFAEAYIFSWMSLQDASTHLNVGNYLNSLTELELQSLHVNVMYEQLMMQIIPFAFKAFVFYQGENDYKHFQLYETSLIRVFKSYRMSFKDLELPIIVIQLAGFGYPGIDEQAVNVIRDAQCSIMDESKNIYTVSAIDLGEENSDVPKDKLVLSRRITNVILEKIYTIGKNSISPIYYSYQKHLDEFVIHMKNNYLNLTSHSNQNRGFTYTKNGVDFIHIKNIEIMNGRIIIKDLPDAKEIRYAYQKFPFCDIYTTNELPLLPFRIKVSD